MAAGFIAVKIPENCSECKFIYEFQGVKKCRMMNILHGNGLISQNSFNTKRHEKCPITPIPEKDKENYCKDYSVAYKAGWNACIDTMTKLEEAELDV